MKRLLLVFAMLVAACTGQSGSRSDKDSIGASRPPARADSAGWRFTYLPGPAIWLRYPVGDVRGVRDQWTPGCDHPAPLFADVKDTAAVDRIIVRAAPAPFDSAVAVGGFAWTRGGTDSGYFLNDLHGATGGDWADTITVGQWRALSTVIMDLAYLDDADSVHSEPPPKDNPDATKPPTRLYSRRVVAVGPMVGRCLTLLAIETHTVVASDRTPMASAVLRTILSGAGR